MRVYALVSQPLLVIRRGGGSDFVHHFRVYKAEPRRISPDLVPIATDPFGNLVCISVTGTRRGEIFFWDHEAEECSTDANEHFISPSFEMFLESLMPLSEVPDSEIPPDVLKLLEEED